MELAKRHFGNKNAMNNRAKKRNFKFIIVYVCVHHSGTKRVQKKNATIKIPIKKNLAGKDFIMQAYEEAVKEQYKFFSFGDAMFIY